MKTFIKQATDYQVPSYYYLDFYSEYRFQFYSYYYSTTIIIITITIIVVLVVTVLTFINFKKINLNSFFKDLTHFISHFFKCWYF